MIRDRKLKVELVCDLCGGTETMEFDAEKEIEPVKGWYRISIDDALLSTVHIYGGRKTAKEVCLKCYQEKIVPITGNTIEAYQQDKFKTE